MWRTIQGVPQNSGAPGWFFCVEFSEKLQPNRKALWNHETRSQAAGLYFMMQLEKVVSQAQQRPFHFDLDGAAEKEPTKAHVFLNHGENALCLDAAIDPDKLSFVCVDPFFHLSSLPGKALGHVDDLAALCQRFLAAACPDAHLFQRATGTVLAAVDRGLHFWIISKTPNKIHQKHKTKHIKNTKSSLTWQQLIAIPEGICYNKADY